MYWFSNALIGDVRPQRDFLFYDSGILQSFTNAPNGVIPLGKMHLAVGFADLGVLLEAMLLSPAYLRVWI